MTSVAEIFPHRTESHVHLFVDSIRVHRDDGVFEVGRQVRIGVRPEYALYLESEVGQWRKALVKLRVEVATERLGDLVASGDDPMDQIAVLVAARSGATRSRAGLRLVKTTGDSWEGELSIERKSARGAIELTPLLVRTRASDHEARSTSGERVASFDGAIVGAGEPALLHVDKPEISPFDGPIKIVWVDFRKEPNFQGFEDDLFRLEFVGDAPTLSLNKGDERFYELISYKGHGTPVAAVRDAMLTSIAQTCWNSLAIASLAHVAEAQRSTDEGEALDALRDWERAVLRKVFSSKVFASKDVDASIVSGIEEFQDPERLPTLLEKVNAAVQRDQKFRAVIGKALAIITKEPG